MKEANLKKLNTIIIPILGYSGKGKAGEKIRDYQGLGGRELNSRTEMIFRVVILLIVDTCHTFVQTHGVYNIKSEPLYKQDTCDNVSVWEHQL